MPAGRPSKYDPSFCELIIQSAEEGKWVAEWARDCGVTKSTLHLWASQKDDSGNLLYPDFSDAFARASNIAEALFDEQTRTATRSGSGHAVLYKWAQSAIFKKSETQVNENTGEGSLVIRYKRSNES